MGSKSAAYSNMIEWQATLCLQSERLRKVIPYTMSEAQLGIPRKVVLRVLNIEVGGVIVRLVWLRVMGLGKKTYIYIYM